MLALLPLVFFMFDTASIAFLTFFIYLQVLFSSVLIFDNFQTRTAWKWIVLVFLFLFISISNLYWEIAYQERILRVLQPDLFIDIVADTPEISIRRSQGDCLPQKIESRNPGSYIFGFAGK
ncbi:hypothetical protein CLV31_103174 [Algoriphagus aquaeductus]|uniref:Uncharacterized protein n=1 Tax=Algoriphagus aquaeductus TaxID=475299 RepID=A0A326S2A7_9BACT|nr:hypothetical protein CLV31_103174 [Algoriphagus aquaeductus]